ncbi:F0F1 ATP synthase subunit epsilon [Cardinium endosymbiont of Bemisia tabaci]|uniref:F0F1 ATP synthase subunit epsilon n=1 Tax=Candidatus Cardinium TaxID=273135 RepID=UPI000442D1D9|nr:F0F1 ATP synthase subunit epsilon [Cardinium endosymbiont of Bemisia tabaci]CDG49977.1 ATP synthase epsilon chain [Cardinium endosymbiont cBtQ1 of Bemisia tabaci]
MNLSIVAPSGSLFNGEVNSVKLPSPLGPFQVCSNHTPILSSLTAGQITYTTGPTTASILVKSGFTSVADNQVIVVCEPVK